MFLQRSDDPSLLFRADDSIVCENNIRRLVLFLIANNSLGVVVVVVAGRSTSKRVVAAVMAFYGCMDPSCNSLIFRKIAGRIDDDYGYDLR